MTDDTPDTHTPAPPHDAPLLFRLEATVPRRVVGTGTLVLLGGFVLYLGLAHPPAALAGRLFLPLFGLGVLWLSLRMWRATAVALELTAEELREAGGRRLAALGDITSVARGTFAFKPSNGFVLVLRRPGPRVWAPGLWWQMGRRIGVGGVTSRQPSRQMAEMIEMLVNARRQAAMADEGKPDSGKPDSGNPGAG